jgi:predicted AAA+ superfamily ATPase
VKSPKLIFLDVGLMAYLLGINDVSQVATHPLRGALFETWGITEQLKRWRNAGSSQRATFLRDKRGTEIDLVIESAGTLQAVEFKSGATISSDWPTAIGQWRRRNVTTDWAKPIVVYGGLENSSRTDVDYVSWRSYLQ